MWTHKKYGKKLFKGKYEYKIFESKDCPTNPIERTFILEHMNKKTNKLIRLTFESFQQAKQIGWTKL